MEPGTLQPIGSATNRKRLRDATIVVQTRVFSFVIKKR